MANQLQNNIASSLSGADLGISATYFNSVEAANIHPYYKREIIQPFGTNRLTSWVAMNSTPSTRPAMSFNHEEVGWMQEPIYSSGVVAGAAGASVTITLTAGSLVGTKTPVAVGFTVLFKNDVFGEITSIPAENQIVVAPAKTTDVISVKANEAFIFYPASFVNEGSCAGNSMLRTLPTNFSGSMQFVRLDETITDEAYASFSDQVTFFDWAAGDGTTQKCWTSAVLIDREIQLHNAIELVALTGMSFTNGTLTALGHRGTNGIIPTIKTYGNLMPYDKNAGFQINDIKDMYKQMEKNKAPKEYIFSTGVDLSVELFDAVKNYFPNGAISYGAFGGSSANAIEMGFNSVAFNNRTFHFQGNEVFTHPSFLGAPNFNYLGAAVVMPATKMMVGGQEVGYIETPRLKGTCTPVLGYDHWVVDGTGIKQTGFLRATNCRRMVFSWWDTIGVEVFGARQLYFVQGS
jgi:hypothetical protein